MATETDIKKKRRFLSLYGT